MWSPSAFESRKLSTFHSQTRRGRCPPRRRLNLDLLEERTLLSAVVHPLFDLGLTDPTHRAALTTSPFPTNVLTVPDTTRTLGGASICRCLTRPRTRLTTRTRR